MARARGALAVLSENESYDFAPANFLFEGARPVRSGTYEDSNSDHSPPSRLGHVVARDGVITEEEITEEDACSLGCPAFEH